MITRNRDACHVTLRVAEESARFGKRREAGEGSYNGIIQGGPVVNKLPMSPWAEQYIRRETDRG